MDRKSAIRAEAERLRARKALPQGKWVPLQFVAGFVKVVNRHGGRPQAKKGWAVVVDRQVGVNDEVLVSQHNGTSRRMFVHSVLVPTSARNDGKCVVLVGRRPKALPVPSKPEESATPMPQGVFASQGPRNPRVCEECEGPCRPGAGRCDRCKAAKQIRWVER